MKNGSGIADGIGSAVFGLSVGIALLPFAPAIVSGSISERVAASSSDLLIQYVSNIHDYGWAGDNLNHVNISSVASNFIMPNADFTSSFTSNAFETNVKNGYVGLGSENASTKNIISNTLIGGFGNKVSSSLDKSIMKYITKGKETPFGIKLATETLGNTFGSVTQMGKEASEGNNDETIEKQ